MKPNRVIALLVCAVATSLLASLPAAGARATRALAAGHNFYNLLPPQDKKTNRGVREGLFASGDYPSLESIIETFLAQGRQKVHRAAIGVAGPVIDGRSYDVGLEKRAEGFGVHFPEGTVDVIPVDIVVSAIIAVAAVVAVALVEVFTRWIVDQLWDEPSGRNSPSERSGIAPAMSGCSG